MLPYSNPGLTKDVYIVVNVFLSIKVFSVAKMFNFLLAFSQIVLQWSFHVRFEFISIPRCLCFVTVSKSELLNVRGNSMVSLFFFKEIVRALLLLALNLTSQLPASYIQIVLLSLQETVQFH